MPLISKRCAYVRMCVCADVNNNFSTSAHQHINTNQKGIALLLVIGSIMILTMIGVEFAYNAQMEYHLAVYQKERLQASYLANSAYNLVRLELKMGNVVQSQIQTATSQAGVQLPIDLSAPFCQQFPIKTTLFRLFMTGEGEKETENEEEGEKEKPSETTRSILASLPLQGVEEFLQFEGDFDGECIDEASKIDLNFFYAQDPSKKVEGADNSYDHYKKFIVSLLSQPSYQELFKKEEIRAGDIVRNIADWIDSNEVINELGTMEGGAEDSIYRENVSGQMASKNGKFSTPGDVFRVEGIKDGWWAKVAELFTIYGVTSATGKPQINVCRAPNDLVKVLILRYTESRTDLPPLKSEDEEILSQLVQSVKGGCTGAVPDKNKIAQDLDAKLLELLKATPLQQPTVPGRAGGYAPVSSFADWIATQSRFFSLNLLGQVGDTQVRVKTVIDLGPGGGQDTTKWKTLYWKIE